MRFYYVKSFRVHLVVVCSAMSRYAEECSVIILQVLYIPALISKFVKIWQYSHYISYSPLNLLKTQRLFQVIFWRKHKYVLISHIHLQLFFSKLPAYKRHITVTRKALCSNCMSQNVAYISFPPYMLQTNWHQHRQFKKQILRLDNNSTEVKLSAWSPCFLITYCLKIWYNNEIIIFHA